MNISMNIQKSRESRELSRYDLAERAGISHVTLWKIEKGKVSPRLNTLEKIAHALGYKSAKQLIGK